MDSKDVVACVALGVGSSVCMVNILKNGDGASTTALFALVGTILGFVFGRKSGETQ